MLDAAELTDPPLSVRTDKLSTWFDFKFDEVLFALLITRAHHLRGPDFFRRLPADLEDLQRAVEVYIRTGQKLAAAGANARFTGEAATEFRELRDGARRS